MWAVEAETYVPVYFSIYVGEGALRSDLAVTLSIRNTSRSKPIVVRGMSYFDNDGELLSYVIEEAHRLGPTATADFFIDVADFEDGTGTNFVISWAADSAVSEPVIEAVMIGWVGAKGISFVSRGARIEAPVGDF